MKSVEWLARSAAVCGAHCVQYPMDRDWVVHHVVRNLPKVRDESYARSRVHVALDELSRMGLIEIEQNQVQWVPGKPLLRGVA